jgi:predicted alpha-1,2-mannosidase
MSSVYYAITFSRPFSSFGTWTGSGSGDGSGTQPGKPAEGNREASQANHKQHIGAYATWAAAAHPQTVTAQIGISYVDMEGAKKNLKAEAAGATFAALHDKAEAAWNQALGAIDVSGGTPANRRIFYTALYHSLMMPSIISDKDGRYLGFDGKIHEAAPGRLIYANYSGWDIYRDQMPLVALIAPKRAEDMAESIVLMDKQGGWIGRWPQMSVYTNIMAGSPLTTIIATTWLDGLHGFDINDAYAGMLRDATQAAPSGKPYQGQVGIDSINTLHYVPDDKVSYGSVSQLQEDSIAYASLYRVAKALGKTEDAKNLYQRSLYYRNLFDPQDRFFRPRDSDGQWVANFNPAQKNGHGFIEGSGWHYQWLAPADMAWLIHAVGRDEFNKRLTAFFDYKKPGWYGQYYNPYNETDLEAPFEFNFSGQPWKSQQAVRRVLSEVYTDTPGGIPGNDDCGAMSSWAVLSMMGIYTVDPASAAYELVSPVFPKIVIHLHAPYAGKEFTIETSTHPDTTPYIQTVELNGHAHTRNWISFQDISRGGTMRFVLGAAPEKAWGSAPADVPPSLSEEQP